MFVADFEALSFQAKMKFEALACGALTMCVTAARAQLLILFLFFDKLINFSILKITSHSLIRWFICFKLFVQRKAFSM